MRGHALSRGLNAALSPYRTELWHVGIVPAPAEQLLQPIGADVPPVVWLPLPGDFSFIADPFGVWRDGQLTVLVEAYDYRDKRGYIHYYHFNAALLLCGEGVALRADHHLSYPFVIEDGGEIYMLPEAHRSGKLTLYRARHFPTDWEPVATLLNAPAIDATLLRQGEYWWLFYTLPGADNAAMRALHLASSRTLMGPFVPHSANPVLSSLAHGRPGGTPFAHAGAVYLPMQDCRETYGGAVQLLRLGRLDAEGIEVTPVRHIQATEFSKEYTAGMHTLSACGAVTLIDVKKVNASWRRGWINMQRRWRRWRGQR